MGGAQLPRRCLPREVVGAPATPFGPAGEALPDAWVDRDRAVARASDLQPRDYLPEPGEPLTRLLAECKEPMTADGIVELIRSGRVRVVAAVADLDAAGARLVDGSHLEVDQVITTTGYRPGLESLVGRLGVLDNAGRPVDAVPRGRDSGSSASSC